VDPALRRAPISTGLGGLGQFPPRGIPRVLWVALERGVEEMRAFWERFEQAIAPLGWTPDPRGFSPHVTVARPGSAALDGDWGSGVEMPALGFSIVECVLFQSVLGRAGAEYLPLKRIPFNRGSA